MDLPPFDRLLDAHGEDVHRYLVAVVGRDEAADCYQETVLAALRAYPALRSAANLRGWLLSVAHNKAMDHHRRGGRSRLTDRDLPERADRVAGDVDAGVPDASLWAAVRRLPEGQRAAVVHRFVLDLPYADIGGVLGCTEAAARQRVRAGLATLRRSLGEPAPSCTRLAEDPR